MTQHNISEDSIEKKAAAWLTHFDGEDATADDYAKFQSWLEEDDRHREVYEALSNEWDEMDSLVSFGKQRRGRAWIRPLMALAASLVVVIISVYLSGENNQSYMTEVGAHQTLILADGSTVHLNTNSAIDVEFTKNKRIVKLLRGEAHFQVAHNADRPFYVNAHNGSVRAVGTAFTVYLKDEGKVEVTVTEGIVEVASAPISTEHDGPMQTLAVLHAGERAEYGTKISEVAMVSAEAIEQKMAWQEGMLLFEGEPLSKAIEEISRYTTTKIIITDKDIRDVRVGGYFRAGDVETLLLSLEVNFDIQADRQNEGLVLLSGKK